MHNNAEHSVDLRSDTVTQPCAAMWDAMRSAPLGDDVLGDEPTVARLEAMIAARLGQRSSGVCSKWNHGKPTGDSRGVRRGR